MTSAPNYNRPSFKLGLVDALPADPEVMLHFKSITVALLGVVAAALGIWAVGLFGDYFQANPFYTPIAITSALSIDVLGALTPIAAALVTSAVFFKTAKAPHKKLATALSAAVAIAFILSHITADGLAAYPLLFSLGAAIAAAAVNVYPKPFSELPKNLTNTALLTLACVPLAMFVVDLSYSPYFPNAVIGGNGLTDGILLSTLYAPLAVTAVFCALSYTSQMRLIVEKSRTQKNPNPTLQTATAFSTP